MAQTIKTEHEYFRFETNKTCQHTFALSSSAATGIHSQCSRSEITCSHVRDRQHGNMAETMCPATLSRKNCMTHLDLI
jgi:hypothetical protein